jgi:hypothetical protein
VGCSRLANGSQRSDSKPSTAAHRPLAPRVTPNYSSSSMTLDLTGEWQVTGAWWRLPAGSVEPVAEEAGSERREEVRSPWPAYGTLAYGPEDGLRLSTVGPQGNPFVDDGMFTLWGEAAGTPVTLLDSYGTGGFAQFPGHAREREIYANQGVYNAHVHSIDDVKSNEWWLETSGIRELLWHEGRGRRRLEASAAPNADTDDKQLEVVVPGGTLTFYLCWDRAFNWSLDTRELHGRVRILLKEPTTYSDLFERWIAPLRDLVTFATREPARIVSLRAVTYDPRPSGIGQAVIPPTASRERLRRDIELLIPQTWLIRGPRSDYHRMLFGLAELGADGEADRVVARWFEMHAALETSRDVFFAALTSRLYIENELLNLMTAAESYHRTLHDSPPLTDERHEELTRAMLAVAATAEECKVYESAIRFANGASQRNRLRFLFDRAVEAIPELRLVRTRFVNQLVDTRNFYTHVGDRTTNVIGGLALRRQLMRLVLVLQINYLRDLGFTLEEVTRLVRRSYIGGDAATLDGNT